MSQKNLDNIGGWLLVYVIWAAFCILFALFSNGNGLLFYRCTLPELAPAGLFVFILTLLFYGYYSWLLYKLVYKKEGVIKKVKIMILATPVFNGSLPAIFTFVLAFTADNVHVGAALAASYPSFFLWALLGAAIIAVAWHRYFCVSRRVRAIWPNG